MKPFSFSAWQLLFSFLLLTLLPLSSAHAAELVRHNVDADGHAMALWEKSVPDAKGHILLHHGRTWSSLPDFDLQVPGEELSLMEGFNAMGFSVWALDARGYGGTARDNSGWNTPDRAAGNASRSTDQGVGGFYAVDGAVS